MSDKKEAFDKEMELEKRKAETAAKKVLLEASYVDAKLEQMLQNERDAAKTATTNFGIMSPDQIIQIQKNNDEYMEAAKHAMEFINPVFNGIVPFFRKNFILIGARTGEGKSTAVANIAYTTLKEINPSTGKTRRVLVLTNEERAEDFYNRVTCLARGWHYTNHSKFTQLQKDTFREMIPILAKRLTVVDNNHNGSHGVTTTIEGFCTIFDSLIASKEYYDVVLIDYYQNYTSSQKYPNLSENDVQARLSRVIDKYKNEYPAPIVMFAQITPPDKDDKIPFQLRIKGRKIIMDPTTCAIEMVRNTKELYTLWRIHKSRFTEAIGQDFKTGYDKGKFVIYDTAFAEKVQKMAYEKEARRIESKIETKEEQKESNDTDQKPSV